MRNLKKTLCLVLALVFVLGLCTVGAVNGTEFSDQEDINYATAVQAMSGLGILKGDDNDGDGKNEFRPADPVTRAEAAKMIAYLVLGADAEKYPKLEVFSDVPATHWAAGYIAYCQNNGIIAGVGDGTFRPTEKVTTAQFAKMLLASCGYNAKKEFEGANWSQNVAKVAMTTKILNNLNTVDWDSPAIREETAQLAYNTMMNVTQVVISKDTDSYVNLVVNGKGKDNGITLAESMWGLVTDEGIVKSNKANVADAKGTELYIIKTGLDAGVSASTYYVTEDDDNGDLLGHQVRILYRVEKVDGNPTKVAYFIEDLSTEVGGRAANNTVNTEIKLKNSSTAVAPKAFNYGVEDSTLAIPPVNGRALDSGTFVLDHDGKLLAYKVSGYFMSLMTTTAGVNYITAPAAAPYDGQTHKVVAPEGAKAGDVLTVYKLGNVYTGKACTKQEKVKITQSAYTTIAGTDYYTYNDKAISYTFADNAGFAAFGATGFDGTAPNLMTVGNSYTLYYDAEGLCYAYGDELDGNAESIQYAIFIADYSPNDAYGNPVAYLQLVSDEGKILNLKAAMDYTIPTAPTPKTGASLSIAPGDICTVSIDSLGSATIAKVTDTTKAQNTDVAYDPTSPIVDYSKATFIWYAGTQSTLMAFPGVYKPKTADATSAAANVRYTFTVENVSGVPVRHVKAVWFTQYGDSAPVADSYVYVTKNDVKEYKLTNDVSLPYYNGYINGTEMKDFLNENNVAPSVGFYTYTKTAKNEYKLKAINVAATAAGVTAGPNARDVYLTKLDTTTNIILDGKLYAGDNHPIDLTNVKIVKVGAAASPSYAAYNVSTVEALQTLMISGKGICIAFVENVVGTTYSIGGGVIYVYAFK